MWGALDRAAKSLRSAGDERTRDQLRADVLVERVTGQASADDVPLEVQLVTPAGTASVSAAVLHALTSANEPATLTGYGPPAPMARDLIRDAELARLRTLVADPMTGVVLGRASRSRVFGRGDRDLLIVRDRTCRTPYCEAPIREADHVEPWASGGMTSIANGQGLCTPCNQAENHPRWRCEPVVDASSRGPHSEPTGRARILAAARAHAAQDAVVTTTPTGHRYTSPTPRMGE